MHRDSRTGIRLAVLAAGYFEKGTFSIHVVEKVVFGISSGFCILSKTPSLILPPVTVFRIRNSERDRGRPD
jgi:hypothetical protein